MLRTDVVVTKLTRFFERELEHTFGSGCERNLDCDETGTSSDDFFNLHTGILEIHAHGLEHLGRDPSSLTNQTEQDLLSANEIVT